MAKKKRKGIFKKILKGALAIGGTVLGVATGVGAIRGIAKGTGALAGIGKGLGALKSRGAKVSDSAKKLITGMTKEQRAILNQVKDQNRVDTQKLEFMQKLIRQGKSEEEAASLAGVNLNTVFQEVGSFLTGAKPEPTPEEKKKQTQQLITWGGVAAAAITILPKLLKS